MSGPPPPPPMPGNAAAPNRPPADAWLDEPLRGVCSVDGQRLPKDCWSAPRPGRIPWPGGVAALTDPQGALTVIGPDERSRLITALASLTSNGSPANRTLCDATSVRAYRQMTARARAVFIDQVWDWTAAPHRFSTIAGDMYVPAPVPAAGADSLPSSWCPDGAGGHARRHNGAHGLDAWSALSIGFRIDGADNAAAVRVFTHGFTQQRLDTGFIEGPLRGQVVRGTAAEDSTKARFWTGTLDIWNESAVCVSRNFFGATAFPLRETTVAAAAARETWPLLWAVNCSGLLGFDTEREQRNQPGAAVWRPGEKAFATIPSSRILGVVRIRRTGAPPGGGWSFSIPADAAWAFTSRATQGQRAYLNGDLDAWRGDHTIPPNWDFA